METASTSPARVDFAYRSVLSRHPEPAETQLVIDFFDQQLAKYQSSPLEAKKAIAFGDSKPPTDVDAAELAAWTLVANLILNLDEAIVRN